MSPLKRALFMVMPFFLFKVQGYIFDSIKYITKNNALFKDVIFEIQLLLKKGFINFNQSSMYVSSQSLHIPLIRHHTYLKLIKICIEGQLGDARASMWACKTATLRTSTTSDLNLRSYKQTTNPKLLTPSFRSN